MKFSIYLFLIVSGLSQVIDLTLQIPSASISSFHQGFAIEWAGIKQFFMKKPSGVRSIDPEEATVDDLNLAAIQLVTNLANLTPENSEKTKLLIRIGAKSTNYLWWIPSAAGPWEPALTKVVPIGPYSLKLLDLVANVTGVKFSIGLSMRSNNITNNYQPEFLNAIKDIITPSNIQSFELGNEPDLYAKNGFRSPSYTPQEFFKENQGYIDFVKSSYPNADFTGPSYAYPWDEIYLPQYIKTFAGQMSYFSFHHYELRGCATNVTLEQLMLEPIDATAYKFYSAAVQALKETGKPGKVIWNEGGTVSCSGEKGISDAFAAALWTLDSGYLSALLEVNHQLLAGSPQALYGPVRRENDSLIITPGYYGMIAFKLANLGNGVTVSQIPVTSGGNVKIYVSNNYANMKTITVINKNYASSGPFVTNIKVDANKFKFATSVVLSAAGGVKDVVGPFSISGITFSSVTGLAQGVSQEKRLKVDQGIVSVSVDAETAMIIRLTDVEVNILDDILKVEDVSLVPKNEDGSPALSRGFINQYLTYLTIVMGLIGFLLL